MTALLRPHPKQARRPRSSAVPPTPAGRSGSRSRTSRAGIGRTGNANPRNGSANTGRSGSTDLRNGRATTGRSGTADLRNGRATTGRSGTADLSKGRAIMGRGTADLGSGRATTGRIGSGRTGPANPGTANLRTGRATAARAGSRRAAAERTGTGRIGTVGPRRERAGTGRTGAVRPVQRPASRRRAAVAAAALLFAAVFAGNVIVHATTTQGQFELEHLKDSAREKEAAYHQLRLQVAELEAPERIVARARQMGMVEPGKVTYLTATAKTSADDGGAPPTVPDAPAEAAQGWGQVKPHLDGRR